MKKTTWVLLVLLIAVLVTAAVAATIWYCPKCGRKNDNNYCPYCGTKRPEETETEQEGTFHRTPSGGSDGGGGSFVIAGGSESEVTGMGEKGPYTEFAYVPAILNQRMATRTGPGTQYDEPGSFFSQGTAVTVLSKAYDSRNGIWWVQVEFQYQNQTMRAYTGVKRFQNLNLNQIPEEEEIGRCTTSWAAKAYYGPSFEYRQIPSIVPRGVTCRIYAYATDGETDFLQIEFYDSSVGRTRRAWVPDSAVGDYSLYDD